MLLERRLEPLWRLVAAAEVEMGAAKALATLQLRQVMRMLEVVVQVTAIRLAPAGATPLKVTPLVALAQVKLPTRELPSLMLQSRLHPRAAKLP